MMAIYKGGSSQYGIPNQDVLRFRDSEKVGGIPNELFSLVVTTTVGQFDVL